MITGCCRPVARLTRIPSSRLGALIDAGRARLAKRASDWRFVSEDQPDSTPYRHGGSCVSICGQMLSGGP